MRAVKVARADVDHPSTEGRTVVGRYLDSLGMQSQCRVAQGDAAFWTPGGWDYGKHLVSVPRVGPGFNAFVVDITVCVDGDGGSGRSRPLTTSQLVGWSWLVECVLYFSTTSIGAPPAPSARPGIAATAGRSRRRGTARQDRGGD